MIFVEVEISGVTFQGKQLIYIACRTKNLQDMIKVW